jgi:hypothetical protein
MVYIYFPSDLFYRYFSLKFDILIIQFRFLKLVRWICDKVNAFMKIRIVECTHGMCILDMLLASKNSAQAVKWKLSIEQFGYFTETGRCL